RALCAGGGGAWVPVPGGTRLGPTSLLDTLIFGRRSGEHAAARATGMPMPTVDDAQLRRDAADIDAIIRRDRPGRRVEKKKEELDNEKNRNVAVSRDEAGLRHAHEVVRRLKEEA